MVARHQHQKRVCLELGNSGVYRVAAGRYAYSEKNLRTALSECRPGGSTTLRKLRLNGNLLLPELPQGVLYESTTGSFAAPLSSRRTAISGLPPYKSRWAVRDPAPRRLIKAAVFARPKGELQGMTCKGVYQKTSFKSGPLLGFGSLRNLVTGGYIICPHDVRQGLRTQQVALLASSPGKPSQAYRDRRAGAFGILPSGIAQLQDSAYQHPESQIGPGRAGPGPTSRAHDLVVSTQRHPRFPEIDRSCKGTQPRAGPPLCHSGLRFELLLNRQLVTRTGKKVPHWGVGWPGCG